MGRVFCSHVKMRSVIAEYTSDKEEPRTLKCRLDSLHRTLEIVITVPYVAPIKIWELEPNHR